MSRTYKSEKPWRDALRKAVNERGPDNRKCLEAIADACVAAAMSGEIAAMMEIGNRLDGKPRQELEVTGETRHYVVHAPLKAIDADRWVDQHVPPKLLTTVQ